MNWLKRNTEAIEAGAAVVTALVAVLALIGVKLQIDASQVQSQEQGARDLFREHLALSMQYPQFSEPAPCPEFSEVEEAAYANYVTHLVYTAEETSAADPSWWPVMSEALNLHAPFLCNNPEFAKNTTTPVARMLNKIAVTACTPDRVPECQ